MTRPARLSYSNIVSTLALVLALGSGGAAVAVSLAKDSVGSRHLKADAVRFVDLHAGSVTGAKIRRGSVLGTDLADGTVGSLDLAAGAVRGANVAERSLTGTDIEYHGITGAEVDERTMGKVPYSALADQLAGFYRGVVSAEGQLDRERSDGVRATSLVAGETARYFVTFHRPVDRCSLLAGVGHNADQSVDGEASIWLAPRLNSPGLNKVVVETRVDGQKAARPFTVLAFCPPDN